MPVNLTNTVLWLKLDLALSSLFDSYLANEKNKKDVVFIINPYY